MIIAKHGRTQVGSLILGGMLLLGLAATAAANPMHDGPEGGKPGAPAMAPDRDFARSMDLTAQQRETLQADRLARGKRLIQLQADKKILHLELEALVAQDAPDMGKIESLAGKIGDLQTKLIVEHAKGRLHLQSILTPEQKKKMPAGFREHPGDKRPCEKCGGGRFEE